jgi:hypothetical protein
MAPAEHGREIMDQRKIAPQGIPDGIYAGLVPADFAMTVRRPPLGEKLKAAAGRAGSAHTVRPDKPHIVKA